MLIETHRNGALASQRKLVGLSADVEEGGYLRIRTNTGVSVVLNPDEWQDVIAASLRFGAVSLAARHPAVVAADKAASSRRKRR